MGLSFSQTTPGEGSVRLPAMDENDQPDWFLREWVTYAGKRQASLVNELGWDKARANFVWHGKQPYRRDIVNEVSRWLGIEPFELLMPPHEAMAIKSFREAARAIASGDPMPIAAEKGRPYTQPPSVKNSKKGSKAA